MSKRANLLISALAVTAVAGCEATKQRLGHSTTVQFGVVSNTEQVSLDSAAAQGAILGGTLGMMFGGGNSRAGNAIKGATLGGAATAIAEGNRKGMAVTVSKLDGSSTRIVTDQREIHVGDCVAVERSGNSANIRRMTESYCDPANERAVRAVDASVQSEAAKCLGAKQELADARSDEAADLAVRKIELLCYG